MKDGWVGAGRREGKDGEYIGDICNTSNNKKNILKNKMKGPFEYMFLQGTHMSGQEADEKMHRLLRDTEGKD